MSEINVKFKRPALEADVAVGSFGELVELMQAEESTLLKLFGHDMEVILTSLKGGVPAVITEGAIADVIETEEKKSGRGRKSHKAVETATAPAPLAPPAAADDDIPAALDRKNPDAVVNQAPPAAAAPVVAAPVVAAPPPPPLLPAAPPVVPAAAPPTGVLATKIIADLDVRAKGSPDGGQALADWLATYHITIKGANYDEAIATVRLTSDEKLAQVGTALGIAA